MLATLRGSDIHLPAFASAHSHAFQRALRSHCQRRGTERGSFWSWRTYMYALVEALTPESIYELSRFAYAELAMAGVSAVGEFHYVHHQAEGRHYDSRTAMSDAVIAAAKDVGIRISLLRVVYQRAGVDKELEPGQHRFVDASVEDALNDVDDLRSRYQDDPLVQIGVAVHSVRAVTRPSIQEVSAYAKAHALPFHMHLSEQRRELEECLSEHGLPPVALMAEDEILDPNFVAVHATHLRDDEVRALGAAGAGVCVCRTTERDLGDGHFDARGLLQAGAVLSTGVDSHAISDPFEEARAIELDQRTVLEGRSVAAEASELLAMGTYNGYRAIGMADRADEDTLVLDGSDPALVGYAPERLDDAVVFAGSPRALRELTVAGETIVREGVHRNYAEIRRAYLKTLAELPSAAMPDSIPPQR